MSPEVKAHANDFVLVGMSEADDAALSAAAMRTILNRLDRHALLTLVFAYRGAFVKIDEYDFDWPNSPLQKAWLTTIRLVGLFFVPAMLWSAASALRKRQYALTLFFVPALFSYAFHAATTHYIARYSAPLVPIFIIALVMTIIPVLSWLRRKVSRKAGRERVNELAASD